MRTGNIDNRLSSLLLGGLFLVFFFLSPNRIQAQEVDNQLWLNYALTVPVTSNFSYGGDVGLRGFVSNLDWNQILVRPTATYRWNQTFSAALAIANFTTFNVNGNNVYEFRIHQDFNVSWPNFDFIDFFWRLRIEERWFWVKDLPTEFNVRTRYLVGAESQDFRLGEGKRPFYFQFIFEGFKTLGDESVYDVFINQTRTHFAFGHRITGRFRYELHYINQRSRLDSSIDLRTTQNIYRIRTFHRLPNKEDRNN